jgi:hypothetical protein
MRGVWGRYPRPDKGLEGRSNRSQFSAQPARWSDLLQVMSLLWEMSDRPLEAQ